MSFAFENFTMASDLLNLLKVAKLDSPFGLAAFLSFLLQLRVPSETLLMRLVAPTDRMSELSRQDFDILDGLCSFKGRNYWS